jgi:hypothetical protein
MQERDTEKCSVATEERAMNSTQRAIAPGSAATYVLVTVDITSQKSKQQPRPAIKAEKRTLELTHTECTLRALLREGEARPTLPLLTLDRVGRTSAQCKLDVCVSSSVRFPTFLVDLG